MGVNNTKDERRVSSQQVIFKEVDFKLTVVIVTILFFCFQSCYLLFFQVVESQEEDNTNPSLHDVSEPATTEVYSFPVNISLSRNSRYS